MLRTLTGMFMGVSLLATPVFAQSTTSTTLSGEAFGFQVMDSTMPDPFSFTAQSGVEPNGIDVISNIISISGITEAVTASVSDLGTGGVPKISVNGALYTTSPVQVNEGDALRVAILPDTGVFSETYQAEVSIGDGSAIFQVTTRDADTTPDAFSIADLADQEPSTLIASSQVTLTGLEGPATISVSGAAGSPQISLDSGTTWVTSGTIANNENFSVRLTSGAFGETRTATVTAGGVSDTFSVTTRSSNDNPVLTSFSAQTGVEPGVTVVSDTITVTGLESSVTASVSGDGLPEFEVNGNGTWIGAAGNASVSNNDTIRVRLTSGAFGETSVSTIDVAGVTEDFSATVRAADTEPDAFTIAAVSDAAANSSVQSSTVINGVEAPSLVTISGEGAPEFSTDGGTTWTGSSGSGTVSAGGTVLVRLTTGTFSSTRTATLDVGGVTADFVVSTASQDTTPDVFVFASELAAPGALNVASETVTLSGFDGGVPILVSGDASAEYRIGTDVGGSIDWDPWTSDAGSVSAGQLIELRLDAAGTEGSSRSMTVSVGDGSATYAVTSQDLTPDAFAFNAVTGATLSAGVNSDPVQISGVSGEVPVSVSAGNGALFRVGTGPDAGNITWGAEGFVDSTETGVTVVNGGWVQMRLTASASYETEVTGVLTIGNGTPETFSVTTGTEPVSITITSGTAPDAEQDEAYAGFDFKTVASVSGGSPSSPPTVNDLAWSVTAGALPVGMSVSAAGVLDGTPTEIGSFSFTVQAELNGQTASASYTIIVNDPDGSLVIEGG